MYILDCIPIVRGPIKMSLTYFTSLNVVAGAIVTIAVRGKKVPALVIAVKQASKLKQDIRALSYSIQKIEKVDAQVFFTEEFIRAINKTSKYFLGSFGNTLSLLTPKIILDNVIKLKTNNSIKKGPKKKSGEKNVLVWAEKIVIQNRDEERISYYKRKIREAFAKNESVFLCLPTISDIEQASKTFSKGIKKYILTLHSSLSKKQILESWQRVLKEKHPVLIIGTSPFLSLPRKDIGIIIVDKESSQAYKFKRAPYIDTQFFAEALARENKITLIVGDVALKAETIYEKESGDVHPTSDVKYRFLTESSCRLIDMTAYRGDKSSFKIISNEAEDALKEAIQNNEHTFIYVNRKGLSPYTVCSDCGNIHSCRQCKGSLILYKNTGGLRNPNTNRQIQTYYMCHSCGLVYSSNLTCTVCDSWRLMPLGIGIEKVEQEIIKIFPKGNIYKIESQTVKTYKKAIQISEQFLKSPSGILIGTEMSLLYLHDQIDNIIVANIDGLFAVPDYRIQERMINILMRLKLLANKQFIIQTRNTKHTVFEAVMSGNLLEFYRNEISERKEFSYPPFTVLIKITKDGYDNEIWNNMNNIVKDLGEYGPVLYQTGYGVPKNKKRLNILIRVEKNKWPEKKLIEYAEDFNLGFRVVVNPPEIL